MLKKVRITLADPHQIFADCYNDIMYGTISASYNLSSQHNINIVRASLDGESVLLEMDIPDDMVDGFNYGYHLRGVAVYLRKRFPEKYPIRRDGRLLRYEEVTP